MAKPIESTKVILKFLLTLVLLGAGLFLIVLSITQTERCRTVKERTVVLEATIIDVQLHTYTEFEDQYSVDIAYTYEGQEYTKRYTQSSDDVWLDRLGQTVEIEVDSENPLVSPDDVVSAMAFAALFGIPLFCAGLLLANTLHRDISKSKDNPQKKTNRTKMSAKKKSCFWLPALTFSACFIVLGIYMAGIDGIGVALMVVGIMSLPFGVILLVKSNSNNKKRRK